MNEVYKRDWAGEGWEAVQRDFCMNEPEPDEVILASYGYEDYSGHADVYYRNGDIYYHVSGGHCSCYGLEYQWEPESYTKDEMIENLSRWNDRDSKEVLAKLTAQKTGTA